MEATWRWMLSQHLRNAFKISSKRALANSSIAPAAFPYGYVVEIAEQIRLNSQLVQVPLP